MDGKGGRIRKHERTEAGHMRFPFLFFAFVAFFFVFYFFCLRVTPVAATYFSCCVTPPWHFHKRPA
jgi:hypothetical protein